MQDDAGDEPVAELIPQPGQVAGGVASRTTVRLDLDAEDPLAAELAMRSTSRRPCSCRR